MFDYSEYNVDVEILKLEEEINLTKVAKMLVFFAIQERLKTQQHVSNETIKELQRAVSRRMMSAIEKDEFHYRVLPGKFLVDELPDDTGYNFDNAKAYYDDIISWAINGSVPVPAEYHPDSPVNQQEQSALNVSQEPSEVILDQPNLKCLPITETTELIQKKAAVEVATPVQEKEPEPEVKTEPKEEKDDNKPVREKNQEAEANGALRGQFVRMFKDKLKIIILEQKGSKCNCNQAKLAAYIKSVWPSLQKQHFGDANLKKKPYFLGKEPYDYISETCLVAYHEMHKKAETEEEKSRWQVVKNKHTGPKTCHIPAHNVI